MPNFYLNLVKGDEISLVCDWHSIETVTLSKYVAEQNRREIRGSNFSACFRVVAIKLTELVWFALPNHWFSSISCVLLASKWRHLGAESFSLSSACAYHNKSVYGFDGYSTGSNWNNCMQQWQHHVCHCCHYSTDNSCYNCNTGNITATIVPSATWSRHLRPAGAGPGSGYPRECIRSSGGQICSVVDV